MKRREFINKSVAFTAGLFLLNAPLVHLSKSSKPVVRLKPVKGELYTPSLLALMESARFETPKEAIRAIKNQKVKFAIEIEEAAS